MYLENGCKDVLTRAFGQYAVIRLDYLNFLGVDKSVYFLTDLLFSHAILKYGLAIIHDFFADQVKDVLVLVAGVNLVIVMFGNEFLLVLSELHGEAKDDVCIDYKHLHFYESYFHEVLLNLMLVALNAGVGACGKCIINLMCIQTIWLCSPQVRELIHARVYQISSEAFIKIKGSLWRESQIV